MFSSRPSPATLEITIFGPGYGESILVHVGSDHWILVDSCIDSRAHRPAALAYLNGIGLDPSTVVDLILASHWHDDHVRGISQILEACPQAVFCVSDALSRKEFVSMVTRFEANQKVAGGSGVTELSKVYTLLQGRAAKRAIADRVLHSLPGSELDHGLDVRLWALSPSDAQVENFLFHLGNSMPEIRETKYRANASRQNDLCVALWISVGEQHILLGSDLEQKSDRDKGWKAVLSSTGRPQEQADVFKIPHHGSVTGHSEDVWDILISDKSTALVTPYTRAGKVLPSDDDVERILGYTDDAYITAASRSRVKKHPRQTVDKTLRELGKKLRPVMPETGAVRLRKNLASGDDGWRVETFFGAHRLSDRQR